jgi:hypothetical protein
MDQIKVKLDDDTENELKSYINNLIVDSVEQARTDSGLDKIFLRKMEAVKFSNLGYAGFNKAVALGLRSHSVSGIEVWSKREIIEFILSNGTKITPD